MLRLGFVSSRIAVLICLVLAACNQPTPSTPNNTIRQQQVVDGLTITLEMAAEPELNRAQHFVVTLTDGQGQPIDDADVYLNLEMTEHPMGTNKPIARPLGAGAYDVEAAYTMTGPWTITVVAERDGQSYQATFNAVVPGEG